MQLEPD
jgi:hypothetical protein